MNVNKTCGHARQNEVINKAISFLCSLLHTQFAVFKIGAKYIPPKDWVYFRASLFNEVQEYNLKLEIEIGTFDTIPLVFGIQLNIEDVLACCSKHELIFTSGVEGVANKTLAYPV